MVQKGLYVMQEYLKNLTNDDYIIFKEVEDVRKNIISQNLPIEIVDYGAGNPNENRSADKMNSGITKNISTKELCHIGLKSDFAHLIYALIKQHKPKHILELGTCCGFSSIYMSKALNNKNIIDTIEGSPQTAEIAQQNFLMCKCTNINLHTGKFSDILPKLLNKDSIYDFVFIDGHHDKDATLQYFKMIKPYLDKNALILFDDISWSNGMKEAWEIIKQDKDIVKYEDFSKLGLCFMKESLK